MKPQIVNIINFIRGTEPRDPELDLLEPVRNQIRLLREFRLPGTFLIQYDAMLRNDIVTLLKDNLNVPFEVGGWLEIVQPLAEKAGLVWRGRPGFKWDWHSHVGFAIGYAPEERKKLVDVFMEDFRQIFGSYPHSVGSWLIDAYTLAYMADRYGVMASCNCKDQWGTDGYSMWGGYYSQAYYPSRKNVFSPAQHAEIQIPVPVFRMLGSDPIYQYDARFPGESGLGPDNVQPVVTLEPVYAENGGGGSPEWVRWYFKENFNDNCLSFGYTQVGQENSFGWKAMEKGLTDQIALLAEKSLKSELRVETLQDSAKWFKDTYKVTPASSIAALSDWKNEGRKSVWYYNRFYRTNLYWENNNFRIRDIFLFDEKYQERYLDRTCKVKDMIYDNLPIMDGYRWSGNNVQAGLVMVEICKNGRPNILNVRQPVVDELGEDSIKIRFEAGKQGEFTIFCKSGSVGICYSDKEQGSEWALEVRYNKESCQDIVRIGKKQIEYCHEGFRYFLEVCEGYIQTDRTAGTTLICPAKDRLTMKFSDKLSEKLTET